MYFCGERVKILHLLVIQNNYSANRNSKAGLAIRKVRATLTISASQDVYR